MNDPRLIAYRTVEQMIAEGAKTHPNESWRDEDKRSHLLKAAGHVITALKQLDGYSPPDGENHAKNALCRLAMALAI